MGLPAAAFPGVRGAECMQEGRPCTAQQSKGRKALLPALCLPAAPRPAKAYPGAGIPALLSAVSSDPLGVSGDATWGVSM